MGIWGGRGTGGGAFRAANAWRKQKSVTGRSQYAWGMESGGGRGRGKDGHCWTGEEARRTSEEDEATANRGLLGGSRTNRLTILVMFFQWKEKKFAVGEMVEFPGTSYADFSLDPVDFSPKWWKNLIREEEEARRRLV